MDLSHFQKHDRFCMLALDHHESFEKIFGNSEDQVIQKKTEILTTLQDEFSGVLLDVEYGLKAYTKKTKPFLLRIEKSGYKEERGGRITELAHTVEELKNLGASGIKLLIYYDHDNNTSNTQMETAQFVLKECRNHNLPLFLEVVTYNDRGLKHQQILSGISLFKDQGILPDVFKLEYPGASEYCQKITQILGSIPWILLTRGEEFDTFKTQLADAIAQGASGFLAGRALWQDASGEELVRRFQQVSAITAK